MNITVAIHQSPSSFSERWIQYCKENRVSYKTVNCFDSDTMKHLKGVGVLLWHWTLNEPVSLLVARHIIASVEKMGIRVFPNSETCWHYDNKIAQKYLLESIEAPLVPTYIFYEKEKAMEWIDRTEFPKVFKLSCGAGSENVKLVKTRKAARKLCERAFGKGFTPTSGYFSDYARKKRQTQGFKQLLEKLKRMPESIRNISKLRQSLKKERNYVYFQDFLSGNDFDTRVVIIGDRAFALRRRNRKNDFRASASGLLEYDPEIIDKEFIKIAFKISKQLCFQSMAYDFLYGFDRKPRLSEISYCFPIGKFLFDCPGYWDDKLVWHDGHVWPEDAIISDLLKEITQL